MTFQLSNDVLFIAVYTNRLLRILRNGLHTFKNTSDNNVFIF
ncbi:hypothetical protein PMAG_a0166 [Pseudoalteromonas mariniglutinosa NCIMB 1770]|nr:hypothetical protein [Pseudoalteromonas mariniglutinosa NCIMB 1770]